MTTADDIWNLISSGDLFEPAEFEELRTRYESESQSGEVLDWLMKQKAITEYHRKVFEAGHGGPFRYGEYVVTDRITEGIFSGGFRARHVKTSHPVVLSFVTSEEAGSWPRIKAAVHAAMHFPSPFLVRCFEAEEVDDFEFIVFEDFNSVPMSSILAKNGPLKPKTACDVIRRIALALQTIHQTGYSHGHISSQNVRVKAGSAVKLFFDPNFHFIPLVKANQVPDPRSLIQVDYSAPELAIPGNRPDELTDIYAVGCLFYELLAGKPPFPIGSIQDRMRQHATRKVNPLENLGYSKALAQFVYFMMAKDRDLRFQNIADVIQQLNALPDSGNPKPKPPENLPTFAAFDKHVRAKIAANIGGHTEVAPTNLLPPSNVRPPRPGENGAMPFESESDNGPSPARPRSNKPEPSNPPSSRPSGPDSTNEAETVNDTTVARSADKESSTLGLQVEPEQAGTATHFRQRQKASLKKTLLPIAITLLVLAIPLALLYFKYKDQLSGQTAQQDNSEQVAPDSSNPRNGSESNNGNGKTQQVTPANYELINDDQRTLWESPTDGPGMELPLAPPGLRWFLSVRGEELFSHDRNNLLVKSLGPEFRPRVDLFEDVAGISWIDTRRLTFSVHDNNIDGQEQLLGAFVVEPVEQKPEAYWLAKWGDCKKQETAKGVFYNSDNGWSYLMETAKSDSGPVVIRFLIAPESLVRDVVDNGPGILHTGLRKLMEEMDSDRQLNLAVIPGDLTSPSGTTQFDPVWIKVLDLMKWYIGGDDRIQAAFLSLHFDGDAVYLETGLRPQLDTDPYTLAEELRKRIADAPKLVDDYMLDIDADRHWKKLAREIPHWVKNVARNSRVGVENKITLVNCWQESSAAHNLLAALEYTLTFAEGSGTAAPPPTTTTRKTPQTIEELLAEVRTIEIANDDLNIAVDKIVEEIKDDYPKLPFDFQIVINGTHLMEEGITKNQRLVNFKVENKPLGDILAEFVFQANTDKTSTGPNDIRTKLIWVLHEKDGKKIVLITTRKAAAREGYTLPKQFIPADGQ